MNKRLLFFAPLFALLLLFGCTSLLDTKSTLSDMTQKCVGTCLAIKSGGADLNSGPCLGLIAPDWVCDIAHNPRLPADNLPENQCPDFTNGNAHYFIEVDTNCFVISTNYTLK